MTMQDTYQWGRLYVDAALTIDRLEDSGAFTGESREALRAFEESGAEFTFDPDYTGFGSSYGFYGAEDGQLPLVKIGDFGGYPGESLETANAQAAKEWAEDRDCILAFSTYFGGCESVSLWFDLSSSVDDLPGAAQEAVELAEGFRDYPVLDEDLWGSIQYDRWNAMIGEMITDEENQRDLTFTDAQREQIGKLTEEYYGNWEEDYFPRSTWDEIVDKVLTGEVQLHQDLELEILFTGNGE